MLNPKHWVFNKHSICKNVNSFDVKFDIKLVNLFLKVMIEEIIEESIRSNLFLMTHFHCGQNLFEIHVFNKYWDDSNDSF